MAFNPLSAFDVFINFRGKDTQQTFTSHLHAALKRSGVETYMDDSLERGGELGPALVKATNYSKISIVIFSNDYASSTWCLDELVFILKCEQVLGQHVIPIFYQIDPSQVRNQSRAYQAAFARHERRFVLDKVAEWREALVNASNLAGFHSASRTVRLRISVDHDRPYLYIKIGDIF